MSEYIQFWLAKHLVTLAIAAIILVGSLSIYLLFMVPVWWRQRRCKHPQYWETRSCQAICTRCGKNLGFIGTVRDNERKKHEVDR